MTENKNETQEVLASLLIVEDDEFVADAYARKLRREGFAVSLAKDGEEALRVMREHLPNLVLLDIMIPLKDGFQVLSEMRRDETLKKARVVVMSNLSQEKDISRAKELGALEYIVKSNVSLSEMASRIRKIVCSN